jgi:hypothetical protein
MKKSQPLTEQGYTWRVILGLRTKHVAPGYHFDSICFYTLFVDVMYIHQRQQQRKTKEAQMGKSLRWRKTDTASAKEPILYSIMPSLFSFFFFFSLC